MPRRRLRRDDQQTRPSKKFPIIPVAIAALAAGGVIYAGYQWNKSRASASNSNGAASASNSNEAANASSDAVSEIDVDRVDTIVKAMAAGITGPKESNLLSDSISSVYSVVTSALKSAPSSLDDIATEMAKLLVKTSNKYRHTMKGRPGITLDERKDQTQDNYVEMYERLLKFYKVEPSCEVWSALNKEAQVTYVRIKCTNGDEKTLFAGSAEDANTFKNLWNQANEIKKKEAFYYNRNGWF